jgi:hypothetical protein
MSMNRFQAMAKIMAMLTEDGSIRPGSRRYKIARKMVARTIDRLGPDAALIQVVDRMPHLMQRLEILMGIEDDRMSPLFLDF